MGNRLILKALRYNLDAHRANPANLFAGAAGMIANNVIFLFGIWGMIFAGKPENAPFLTYYLALNTVVMLSWGSLNFFFGGLKSLGDIITEGTLEPMVAAPRDPILLAGISRSHAIALGDLLMGAIGLAVLFIKLSPAIGARSIVAALISTVAFAGVFIFAGSLSFFIPKGSQIGQLLIEVTVSLSVYPTGKMFERSGRVLLLLTPAAITAVLPLEAVESVGAKVFLIAGLAALGFMAFSVAFFRIGLTRYRAVNII